VWQPFAVVSTEPAAITFGSARGLTDKEIS
jgi:hypothetical protein